jgi:hypothetical protein
MRSVFDDLVSASCHAPESVVPIQSLVEGSCGVVGDAFLVARRDLSTTVTESIDQNPSTFQ